MTELQSLLREPLQQYLNSQETTIALAMTFGTKDLMGKELLDKIKVIGVSHMMVLSGANISMFISFVSSALYFLPNKLRETIAIATTIVFLTFIPLQPSIVRAALMSFIPRIGSMFGRRSHNLYLLFLTCSLLLCFDIQILYDISFQLSFLAILGINLFYKHTEIEDENLNIVSQVTKSIKEQVLLGFSAQAFTVPLIWYYFGNMSLLSPISNLLLSPFVSPIMVGTIIVIAAQRAPPPLAGMFGLSLKLLLTILTVIIEHLSKLTMFYVQY
ncbi:ComEC/Rec2 family competence protein [Candidatus Woesebacteria bacterium]|nr:ComEC/Rec2 family competence protein [Candidatus Woesebacteria bacterium]